MDVAGCTLDFGQITDLGCELVHYLCSIAELLVNFSFIVSPGVPGQCFSAF